MSFTFQLESPFQPQGDQPAAIEALITGFRRGERNQVLLGVTGSGKTFTMAHVVNTLKRPTLIMAPNKTLAAQLYSEMKEFFPHNAVEYFVSYYDYYQPEAYVPKTDTYIEKESTINEDIDRMRHSATRALLTRDDVIVVASVSCLYGIGDVETYQQMSRHYKKGQTISPQTVARELTDIQYKRNDLDFSRGAFRMKGDILDLFPAHLHDRAWRLSFFGDEIDAIQEFDPLTGEIFGHNEEIVIFANSHYVTPKPTLLQAIESMKQDLKYQLELFEKQKKLIEAQRLRERTEFDIEMLITTGMCNGIENYSRYLTGRAPGEPPPTLFEYLPKHALLIIDESHVTIPQINGMYKGDRARKTTLAEYGFRLPACVDNRPLMFEEWDASRPQTLFVSATPSQWELTQTQGVVVEQIIRPTGLVDPICEVQPTEGQIDHVLSTCRSAITHNQRVLITTLTKKMAELLSEYMHDNNIKARYIHSDVETLERIEIIRLLRMGEIDVLIGINLLREGLDIPECARVLILDADKQGFLRSKTSLIQTIGRAARNLEGRVVLYADNITQAMREALDETNRRRALQIAYNEAHGLTPETISKKIPEIAHHFERKNPKLAIQQADGKLKPKLSEKERQRKITSIEKRMKLAAQNLEFEEAAKLRDELCELKQYAL